MGLHMDSETRVALVTGVVGVGAGGLQVAATTAWDNAGSGAAIVPQIGTNGQLVNFGTGLVGTAIGLIGSFGKTRILGNHRGFSGALLGYGLSTLLFGWLVPKLVAMIGGTAARARAAFRQGYNQGGTTPSGIPTSHAPAATQRNLAVLGALTA
jgi:hypothetical protein